MKRIADFLLSSLLLLLTLPIMAILSFVIYVCMGGPVIFRQIRAGRNGEPFTIYKFRTMQAAKSKIVDPTTDENRLTAVGRFIRKYSLDELPQLLNVWKGEMSFIGPRPLLMEYVPLYSQEQKKRLLVKPGVTGWAQVNGRNSISWEEKFLFDVWYVENRTLVIDLKIIWMTIIRVIRPSGINQQGTTTMEKFRGTNEVSE